MMGFFCLYEIFCLYLYKLKNLYYVRKNYTSFIYIIIVWDVYL